MHFKFQPFLYAQDFQCLTRSDDSIQKPQSNSLHFSCAKPLECCTQLTVGVPNISTELSSQTGKQITESINIYKELHATIFITNLI